MTQNFLEFNGIVGGEITSLALYNEFKQYNSPDDETPSIPLKPNVRFTHDVSNVAVSITDRNLMQTIEENQDSNIWQTWGDTGDIVKFPLQLLFLFNKQ